MLYFVALSTISYIAHRIAVSQTDFSLYIKENADGNISVLLKQLLFLGGIEHQQIFYLTFQYGT